MPKEVVMVETFDVTVQIDELDVKLAPSRMSFGDWTEAAAAMQRALELGAPEDVTVIVSRELVPKDEWDAEPDRPEFDDWPNAEKHLTREREASPC